MPLPESMVIKISDAIWGNSATMRHEQTCRRCRDDISKCILLKYLNVSFIGAN